jgi:hypothetical protein
VVTERDAVVTEKELLWSLKRDYCGHSGRATSVTFLSADYVTGE